MRTSSLNRALASCSRQRGAAGWSEFVEVADVFLVTLLAADNHLERFVASRGLLPAGGTVERSLKCLRVDSLGKAASSLPRT
jgi:hypothetical protein